MNVKKHMLLVAFAMTSALAMPASVASAQDAQVQPTSIPHGLGSTIQGVWRTVVTSHNCETGVPSTSLHGLFTFHQGGTMSEYGIRPGSSPALRSPGHGVWQREPGWQEYSFAFTFSRYNASGVSLGFQRVSAALELAANGSEFFTRSAIEIFDVTDTLIATSCATGVGTRFE